jgi:hypothetical protein
MKEMCESCGRAPARHEVEFDDVDEEWPAVTMKVCDGCLPRDGSGRRR